MGASNPLQHPNVPSPHSTKGRGFFAIRRERAGASRAIPSGDKPRRGRRRLGCPGSHLHAGCLSKGVAEPSAAARRSTPHSPLSPLPDSLGADTRMGGLEHCQIAVKLIRSGFVPHGRARNDTDGLRADALDCRSRRIPAARAGPQGPRNQGRSHGSSSSPQMRPELPQRVASLTLSRKRTISSEISASCGPISPSERRRGQRRARSRGSCRPRQSWRSSRPRPR